MTNFDRYREQVMDSCKIYEDKTYEVTIHDRYMKFKNTEEYIRWLLEESKDPVLEDKERKWLSDFLRPFKEQIRYLIKFKKPYTQEEVLQIVFIRGYIILPSFTQHTLYNGLEEGMHYSPKDLGLFEDTDND